VGDGPSVSLIHVKKKSGYVKSHVCLADTDKFTDDYSYEPYWVTKVRIKNSASEDICSHGWGGEWCGVRAGDRPELSRLHSSILCHDPDITKGSNKNLIHKT
jgi:hypothetical protein